MCEHHKLLTKNVVSEFLPRRDDKGNKYDFGHVLIIAGSKNYPGAPLLASLGALYSGAGLVSLCVPESIYPVVCSRAVLELIIFPLPETSSGTISVKAIDVILDYISKRKVNTICLGCGLGINNETKQFVNNFIKLIYNPYSKFYEKNLFLVLDADGINLLDVKDRKIIGLQQEYKVVLTPHLGEYSRLVEKSFKNKDVDLCTEIMSFSRENKVILVLKGAETRITDGDHIFVNNLPNSGLAKGGSGDILSGLIAGFVYQIEKFSPAVQWKNFSSLLKSALLSVYLHSRAGEICSKEKTVFSYKVSDILEYLPEVIKEL